MYLNKTMASNANNSVELETKFRIVLMRSAVIKKASEDEQQNQTTITTNITYIQILMSSFFLKKNNWLARSNSVR